MATSLKGAKMAAAWYWQGQRGWIEQSFKDSKSRFGLARVRVGSPERLSRLLMALSVALTWLSLMVTRAAREVEAALARGYPGCGKRLGANE